MQYVGPIGSYPATPLGRYIHHAQEAGVPRDQLERFRTFGYCAQPKQLEFHAACRLCDVDGGPVEVGFGGARGPGKSHALLAQLVLDDCARMEGLKALLLRRIGKAVRESFEDLRMKVLLHMPHEYVRSDGVLRIDNGSRVVLGHFKDERDVDAYLGLEFDVVGVEEATTLSYAKYKAIRTCCRTSKDGWRARTYSNANPGGIGHAWYKERFRPNDPSDRSGEEPRFVHATIEDNSFLGEEYRKVLGDLTGWRKRAWRYGDWDISAGQYFTTFSREIHVMPPMLIPSWWSIWLSMDYGYAPTHWNVIYVLAEDSHGNIYVIGELPHRKTMVRVISAELVGLLMRLGIERERIERFVVGGDTFTKSGTSGESIADQWREMGWEVERSNMDRLGGAAEVLRRLGDAERGIPPTMFIFASCPMLIGCIPQLEHDPRRPDDVLKVAADEEGIGGDDPYDSLRYGLMVRCSGPELSAVASPTREWRG
jgi:phage terminase large subunit